MTICNVNAYKTIKKNIIEILPHVSIESISPDVSMRDLGANSIDRVDVIIKSMADLGIKIPLVELAQIKVSVNCPSILKKVHGVRHTRLRV